MFGPSSSPYKVNHSGSESAVVECLMLLAAFLTPLRRDSVISLLLLVEISGISLGARVA